MDFAASGHTSWPCFWAKGFVGMAYHNCCFIVAHDRKLTWSRRCSQPTPTRTRPRGETNHWVRLHFLLSVAHRRQESESAQLERHPAPRMGVWVCFEGAPFVWFQGEAKTMPYPDVAHSKRVVTIDQIGGDLSLGIESNANWNVFWADTVNS